MCAQDVRVERSSGLVTYTAEYVRGFKSSLLSMTERIIRVQNKLKVDCLLFSSLLRDGLVMKKENHLVIIDVRTNITTLVM